MAWVLSILSVLMLWLMGNKSRYGPIVGIVAQVLWIIYVLKIEEYGLLLGVIAYTIVHIRNFWKWHTE